LNECIPWTSVLPVLGVQVSGSALPATVRCPACQHQTLTVYKDPVRQGQWYHCSGCGLAGDGAELTAAVGDISVGSAVLKLATRGLPILPELLEPVWLDRYEKRSDFRRRTMAFWKAARSSTGNTGNTGPAQRKLGIAPGVTLSPEWPRRGGRFVGHCKAIQAEELLRPVALNYRLSIGKSSAGNAGWRPLFRGRGWDDLLVVAYHNMPGRLAGFLFIGREARWPDDFIFAPCSGMASPTMGVSMFEAALPPHREFGATIFVVEDPVLALRIQIRHLIDTDVPLPVVGAWGAAEPRCIWPSMPRRDLVHWSPEPDGRLIARARLSCGRVALAPTGTAIAGHLERSRPSLALRGMLAAAQPWDAALEALLGRLSPARAEELVLSLKLKPDETSSFLRACTDDTRARLSALFMDAGKPRGVTISGKTIIESGGAWRVAKTGELVCDAVLRVEQVIRTAAGGVSYRGRIEYRGQSLPFWAPDREIEKDTLRWVRTKVGQAGLGEVVIGSIYWSKRMLTIAQQFEPPRAARGLDVVGWDEAINAFTLPQFVLRGNGEVAVPDYVVPAEALLPAAALAPPEGLTPGARVAPARRDAPGSLFWAAATCLLADILAPALGLPRCSTALAGDGAVAVGAATALAFGCVAARIPDSYHFAVSAQAHHMVTAHRWPVLLRRTDAPAGSLSSKALTAFPAGIVAAAAPWMADSLTLLGGWHVITASQPAAADLATEHGGTILRAYLKDLCERRLYLEIQGTLLEAIHADLIAWYGQFASPLAIEESWPYIRPDDPAAHPDRFGLLVADLIACGELHLAKPGTNRPQVVVLLGDDKAHIPKWGVNEGLTRKRAVLLDADAISTRLSAAGVLLDERDQDYVAGWVVPERWLRQHMDYRRQRIRTRLGIVN
jgi:hypothetical protein